MDKNRAIVAKLKCTNKLSWAAKNGGKIFRIDFHPVDTAFASRLSLFGVSKQAAKDLKVGEEYFLTIMPTEILEKKAVTIES